MFKILVVLTIYLSCFTHVFCNTSNRKILPGIAKKLINSSNFESVADNKTVVTLGDKRIIHGIKPLADVNTKISLSNALSKLKPENKKMFSKIQANKKNSSIVVRPFNRTENLSKLNTANQENDITVLPSNKSLLDRIESKSKGTSFIVGAKSNELSVNKTVTSLRNTTLPPDKIPIKQRSKSKHNNSTDNVSIADNQIAVLPQNERIIDGSNSKPKLITYIIPKADNKTAKLPANKLVKNGNKTKPTLFPFTVPKSDNNTAKLPGNEQIILGSKTKAELFSSTVPKSDNNTAKLPGKKQIIVGSKIKSKLFPSTVPKSDNNTAKLSGNEQIIHGSKTKAELFPSTIPKPDNNTAKLPGSKQIIHGSKTKSELFPSTVPKSDNNTAKLPGKKQIIVGSKIKSKLFPSTVPKSDNNTATLSGNEQIIHGGKTKSELFPSTIPKPDNNTAKLPGSKQIIHGSKTKSELFPSTVPKSDNNTVKLSGKKQIIVGSKTKSKLFPSTVPKPDNNTAKLLENKQIVHENKTKPKLMPSVVSEVNNKTKIPFKADNKTIKIIGHQRIVQGIEAKQQQFPFIVSIVDRKISAHRCGGSIIDVYHILTAAHCCVTSTQNTVDYHKILIQAGDINIGKSISGPNRIYRDPVEVIPHPLYNSITIENDICIIRYSNQLVISMDVEIIPLGRSTPKPDQLCEIAGWGTVSQSDKTQTLTLRTANIRIIDMDKCNGRGAYAGFVPPLTVCAGEETASGILSQDACQGDSGGPLVCNKILNGIVSFGHGCGDSQFPGVYTDVSKFRTWIESVLNRTHPHNHNHGVMLKNKLNFTLLMVMTTILNLVKSY